MKMIELKPANRIASLEPYMPPNRVDSVLLKLDSNEGAAVDESVTNIIETIDASELTRYPNTSELERDIAKRFRLDPSSVIVTNGGDDAIDRACRAVLNPGDLMLTHTPNFEMISRSALLAGASVDSIRWLDGEFPTEEFLIAIDESTKLISLVSPCNPTGKTINAQSITKIAEKAQTVGAIVMLDQAYVEFADEDPVSNLLGLPNLIIIRTMSKAMGLAGIRVGYAIGPGELIRWLRTVGSPFPISTLSIAIARAANQRIEDRNEIIHRTREYRELLISALKAIDANPLSSQANFVLTKFENAERVHAQLIQQGISVRKFGTDSGISSYLRMTVPAELDQLNQVLKALNTIGASQ